MFATTRWSLVLAAGDGGDDARAALDQLCRIYRPAVLAYLRSRGHSRSDADDLTQGFFARFVEKRLHETAEPARGRFRTYLRSALHHFVINMAEYDNAERRRARPRAKWIRTAWPPRTPIDPTAPSSAPGRLPWCSGRGSG